MKERFRVGVMISVFMGLVALVCAQFVLGPLARPNEPKINQIKDVPALTSTEIRSPDIASKYGITGYLEITYPSDSPGLVSIDRGGEVNIKILLHFVSYTPEITEAQVNIDPKSPWGLRIEQGDVIFNDLVSYNPSGNIAIKAGETITVMMSISIPEDFPKSIGAIPLGDMGIAADVPIISELGGKEVAIHE